MRMKRHSIANQPSQLEDQLYSVVITAVMLGLWLWIGYGMIGRVQS